MVNFSTIIILGRFDKTVNMLKQFLIYIKMDHLVNLAGTLSSLKEVSNAILDDRLPITEKIALSNNIIDEVVARTGADANEVTDFIHAMTLETIADAEVVKKEIDAFIFAVCDCKFGVEKNIDAYPFLSDVWFGDKYSGKKYLSAIQFLLTDLKSIDLMTINNCWFIETAVVHFSSDTHDDIADAYRKHQAFTFRRMVERFDSDKL